MKTKATYESVIAAIARLKENHQEPTLDAILSITGGSKGTVHKHWNRYREEHRSFHALAGGLSAVIQNAIMAEISSKINEAKIHLETDLCEEKAVSRSLADSNEKQEAIIDELQDKLFKLETLLAKAQGRYEQADKEAQTERKKAEQSGVKLAEFSLKLEISENNLERMKKQKADDKLQRTQYQEKATQSEKKAAVAVQQVSDLNQRLNEQIEARAQQTTGLQSAQKTIEKQNVELKKLERAKAQAEQTAVIAQVKLEHAGNRDPVQAD